MIRLDLLTHFFANIVLLQLLRIYLFRDYMLSFIIGSLIGIIYEMASVVFDFGVMDITDIGANILGLGFGILITMELRRRR